MKGRKSNPRKLSFQRLERRELMAGNVRAAMSGDGSLHITGDDAANRVWLIETSPQTFAVVGQSSTAINGRMGNTPIFHVTGDIDVALAGGQDEFHLGGYGRTNQVSCRNLNIDMGTGSRQDVLLTTSSGLWMGNGQALRVGGNVTIAGSNVSSISIQSTEIGGNLRFSGSLDPTGTQVMMVNSTVKQNVVLDLQSDQSGTGLSFAGHFQGDQKTVGGTLNIRGSSAREVLYLNAVDIAVADIDLGDGRDAFQVNGPSMVEAGTISGGAGVRNQAIINPQYISGRVRLSNFG